MRARYGLVGLLGFEGVLAAYTLANGALDFAATALASMAALAWALLATERGRPLPRGALVVLVAATLLRGLLQTAFVGGFPPGILPTFLVPAGFALLAWPRVRPAIGIALVAAARTWFVAWYFVNGGTTIALANVVGAAGCWLWLFAEGGEARAAPEDAPGPA